MRYENSTEHLWIAIIRTNARDKGTTRTEIIGQRESLVIVAGIGSKHDRDGLRLLMERRRDWIVLTLGIVVFPNSCFHIGGTFAKPIQLRAQQTF